MITIKCDKCGKESDNHFEFDSARFSYIDGGNALHWIHLCKPCQGLLQKTEEEMFAVFMEVPGLRGWDRHDGID